ncbi:hypothetical protein SAMN02787079_01276 [Lysinibacillus sp. TC-37]|nr:hypothetical protein SAMN02787078_01274 [Lysinibacillus sp. SG9]SDB17519.1 hypothetical protein SAMN02787079_01276 [Lysinibacillus sp. TC-37]SFS64981.1 hypothetical protein SAMN02787087_01281 [Lysinibacillus sp. SG55]
MYIDFYRDIFLSLHNFLLLGLYINYMFTKCKRFITIVICSFIKLFNFLFDMEMEAQQFLRFTTNQTPLNQDLLHLSHGDEVF